MEGSSRCRRSSSEKLGPGGGDDRISALPDDLLLLILARLECAATAARTGILSGRWRGLWVRLRRIVLRDVPFHSLEPALTRVSRPPPTVSLLQIRLPKDSLVDTARLSSLLRAAARIDPEKLFLIYPSGLFDDSSAIDLPCFHRATSIVLDLQSHGGQPTIRCVPAGVEFPALETLSLSGCTANFDTLLSRCPRLRTLRLANVWFDEGNLRINSPLLQELVVARSWIYHVNIVTPMLKQLTMSIHLPQEVSVSILAPMIEKVSWDCSISNCAILDFWRVTKLSLRTAERQGQLSSLHIHAYIELSTFPQEEVEIEKHMIADFSVLELHLTTKGHVFGAFLCHLLGINQIRCAIKMLKVDLQRSAVKVRCSQDCSCNAPNWTSQTISLTALEEVDINCFEGDEHEIDIKMCANASKSDSESIT